MVGGEGGIRTLDTGLPYTHFPGVLLQPLGHLSVYLHGSASRPSEKSFLKRSTLACTLFRASCPPPLRGQCATRHCSRSFQAIWSTTRTPLRIEQARKGKPEPAAVQIPPQTTGIIYMAERVGLTRAPPWTLTPWAPGRRPKRQSCRFVEQGPPSASLNTRLRRWARIIAMDGMYAGCAGVKKPASAARRSGADCTSPSGCAPRRRPRPPGVIYPRQGLFGANTPW